MVGIEAETGWSDPGPDIETLLEVKERLGALVRTGHTVLSSGESLPREYVALPPIEGNDAGAVVFVERAHPSWIQHIVTEGEVVTGAMRRGGHFPWRLERVGCSASDIRLGDRVVLQDPDTGEEHTTRKMSNPWGDRLKSRIARLGITGL